MSYLFRNLALLALLSSAALGLVACKEEAATQAPVATEAAAAPAKSGGIAVVDVEALLDKSDAAKNIQAQIKVLRESLQKEIASIESDLKASEKAIVEKRKSISAEEFEKERKAFEKKIQDGRAKVQKRRENVDAAVNKAINQLREEIVKVTADLSTERNFDLVITRQNVIVGQMSLDQTEEVLKRLNVKIKEIKINVN